MGLCLQEIHLVYQMKLLLVNIRGLRKPWKRKWVRESIGKEKVEFLAIQETKLSDIPPQLVRSIWDSDNFGFVAENVTGTAGGLLWVWNKDAFDLHHSVSGAGFVLIKGELLSIKKEIVMINVYSLQAESEKKLLRSRLLELNGRHRFPTCWIGDFNAVRYIKDRRGSQFNAREAKEFNNLITESGLTEVKLVDRRFTWINKSGASMSKLDRVFCSYCFLALWPDLYASSRGRVVLDHFPIIVQNKMVDFGPKPFRVYNHWLLQENIAVTISEAWSTPVHGKPDFMLKQKLKALKNSLKSQCKSLVSCSEAKVSSLRKEKERWTA